MPGRGSREVACQFCSSTSLVEVHKFEASPPGEPDYGFQPYSRVLKRCEACGHFSNHHDFNFASLYDSGEYRRSAYGETHRRFEKIMALPPERSDNAQRVARIVDFAHRQGSSERSVLDIGSGMAVFAAAISRAGWSATVVDPDPDNVAHALRVGAAAGVAGDFLGVTLDGTFSMVTLNKVLEHIPDPVTMLSRCRPLLAAAGSVYLEVPDGEQAMRLAGPDREEFFVDHYHAFSAASFALMIARAGFSLVEMSRLQEPSGKYTLFAFLR
jgi:2-polyprenyl-3-methyl-5-hydroxy-6-metoxy-1,4-benzoquinol methylase